jgi:hypothetical protein
VDVTEEQPDRAPRLEPSARDPDIWQALGQFTIHYSLLEEQLRFSIWALMETAEQEPARIVLAGTQFKALVDMFCSLCRLRRVNPKRIKVLQRELERVAKQRNEYIHSDWSVGRSAGSVTRSRHTARAEQGLRFSLEHVTAADIRALADEIMRVATRVAWVEAPGDFMGLWPEEHK